MGKNDIEPRGANPLWPVADATGRELAFPVAASEAERPAMNLNLATLWRILYEWRWLILGAGAAGVVAAIVYTLMQTPLYRSTAIVEINPPTVEILEGNKGGGGRNAYDFEFLPTQYGLLESRSLAARVAQELNLASRPEIVPPELDRAARERVATNVLMRGLDVKPLPKSRLIRVEFSSTDPAFAAQAANGFAENFIRTGLERRYEASSYARNFLERQIANVRRDLETSERQLVAYAQQQGIINTATPGGEGGDTSSLTGASLVAINEALSEAQARRIAAEQRYRQSLNAGTSAEANERTSVLRQQKAVLEAEYQEKLNTFQPDYPEMVRLRSRIDTLDQSIRSEASGVQTSRANTLQAEYRAAVAEEQQLQGRVDQLRGAVLNMRGRSIQYNILQREVDTNRSLYDALLQRYKEIGVAGGVGTSQASVVDRGEIPTGPYSPNLPVNLMLGLMLGLATGAAGALAAEFINDTIKTPDDVRNRLGLAFLGAVPRSKSDSILDELADQASALSESYFSVSTSLQFSSEHGVPKTLLITSTRPAEGKSTSTWALALSFARSGRRVLLIDSDLRKPTFKTQQKDGTGLSNLLTNEENLADHVSKTEIENIWLLPCGPLPPNPAELLSGTRIRAVLADAASQFDVVLVDGPPVLGLADAPLLGSVCHGVLLVAEAGKTRTKAAVESLHRLRAAGAHMVGGILTRYRQQAAGYGYYNYDQYRYGEVKDDGRAIQLITYRDKQ